MTDVLMPRLSDSMEQGTILTWLIDDGAAVTAGAELAEIETDKATMTYEAEADGLLSVVVPAGSTVAVGEVIARVGDGTAPAEGAAVAPAAQATPAALVAPAERSGHEGDASPRPDAPQPVTSAIAPAMRNGDGADDHDDIAATPMARRIAAAHGVTLGAITGTGPRGRILRADVMRAAGIETPPAVTRSRTTSRPTPAPDVAAAPGPAPAAGEDDVRVPLSRLQTTIARRMAEAKATVPHFQVQTDAEVTALLALREGLRTGAAARELPVPSLNDLIVRACALALRRFPRANGSYVDGGFVLHGRVNVGVAVAGQDALVVPVVHDADALSLGEIARRTRELAAAVRDGTVTPPQLSGATFTVSNLGMYGMTAIAPVVNPPQAAILGVGAVRDVLARGADGEIVDRSLLTLTLSCDHRILYGADAAAFLSAIRDLLQAPTGLLL